MDPLRPALTWTLCAAAMVHLVGCQRCQPAAAVGQRISGELVIFHAGSLAVPLREAAREFGGRYPNVVVRMEAAGSRDSARKICDLGRPCDVMASADYRVIEELLMPAHADFNIRFAANEMAIAFTSRSRLAQEITSDNWYDLLLRPEVRFGRADPNRDPCGYRTEMLFQLAERHYGRPGLAAKLLAKDQRFIRPKETDLLALLESGEIDYLFIYRSVIHQHRLSMVALPDEVNLKSPALDELYRTASAQVTGGAPGELVSRRGEAIVYSLTVCRNAPNPPAALAFVALLLGPEGRLIISRNGQQPLDPPIADGWQRLPEALKPLCRPVEKP